MTGSAVTRVWRTYVSGGALALALATGLWNTQPAVLA